MLFGLHYHELFDFEQMEDGRSPLPFFAEAHDILDIEQYPDEQLSDFEADAFEEEFAYALDGHTYAEEEDEEIIHHLAEINGEPYRVRDEIDEGPDDADEDGEGDDDADDGNV